MKNAKSWHAREIWIQCEPTLFLYVQIASNPPLLQVNILWKPFVFIIHYVPLFFFYLSFILKYVL